MKMEQEALRRQMVAICRQSLEEGLFTGTSGNLSVNLGDGTMLITPTSVRYTVMEPEDIVRCDLSGQVREGELRPSSEWRMHAIVYRNYPETGAIFHTHSPYATAFAVVQKPIPAVLIEMQVFLGGDVPCAPYATPGTDAVGESVLSCLRERNGCLLANHGVLAVGGDLDEARTRAEYIEDAAKIYHHAVALGRPVTIEKL